MKKFFMPLAFIAVMGMQAQTTIVEEKFEKDNKPLDYNFLPKSNKLVIQKGNVPKVIVYKKIQSLNEYTSTSEKKILLENVEVMDCNFSATEGGFKVTDYTTFRIGHKVKFYSNSKKSDYFDYDKIIRYKFSDNYGVYISDKSGSTANKLDEDKITLNSLDLFTKKVKDINIELPNLSRLQGDNLLKQVVGSRSASIKKYGIGYKLNILDNEHFEIVTKGIDKEYKSMTLYRTIYNLQGKIVEDLKYNIDLKGLYLVNSFNEGGKRGINSVDRMVFGDDLSINNYIIDESTKTIYVYGLFGKESENSPSGYYIFKFSEKGEKLFESINYITNKDFQDEAYKSHLYNAPIIIGDTLLFIAGRTDVFFDKFLNYNYSFLDINSGKEIRSKFITYKIEKLDGHRNFIEAWHTNKELKNKALDRNAYVLYDCNPSIKKHINSIVNKEKVSIKCEISGEGIWLLESDNEEYYKVTYFEN
jgi:hypothetical protein